MLMVTIYKWVMTYLDNKTTKQLTRRYIVLNIVPGGSLSWSNAVARFFNPSAEQGLAYTYYSGQHTLLSQDVTVSHNAQGEHTETITGNVTSGYVSWIFSKSVAFPKINTLTQLESFTGTSVNGNFRATYTPNGKYKYNLAIAIAGVKTVQVFENYVSGTDVTLSDDAINQIKNYTSNKTVTIAGMLQNWYGGAWLGDSNEIRIPVKINQGVRLRVNGEWKEAVPYVRVNGQWKEAVPYVRVNNQWKEGI